MEAMGVNAMYKTIYSEKNYPPGSMWKDTNTGKTYVMGGNGNWEQAGKEDLQTTCIQDLPPSITQSFNKKLLESPMPDSVRSHTSTPPGCRKAVPIRDILEDQTTSGYRLTNNYWKDPFNRYLVWNGKESVPLKTEDNLPHCYKVIF